MVDIDPPVIRCDEAGSFPWSVLHDRHPALIAKIRAAYPYPPAIDRALTDLLAEMLYAPMAPLPADAHDAAGWLRFDAGRYFGRSWYDAPFLFAESYFYRRVLEAVDYFRDGPWHGVDPYRPEKRQELATPAIDAELAALDALIPDLAALTEAAVWGNRADLVFLMADRGSLANGPTGDLLINDGAAWWQFVKDSGRVRLGYVADNSGCEFLHDLVLIDHLLAADLVAAVTVFVKPQPYFISDVLPADLDDCLTRLDTGPPAAHAIATRLAQARAERRLAVNADPLFCWPMPYAEVDLDAVFAGIDVTILKGDLNYRRLIGDRHWHGAESLGDVSAYFPTPFVTLRTVKSEVIVGIPVERLARLDEIEPGWRFTGKHAVIQARLGRPAR